MNRPQQERVSFNLTATERYALRILSASFNWTTSYILRKGLFRVIEEAARG